LGQRQQQQQQRQQRVYPERSELEKSIMSCPTLKALAGVVSALSYMRPYAWSNRFVQQLVLDVCAPASTGFQARSAAAAAAEECCHS
jgi:hypothetical protein